MCGLLSVRCLAIIINTASQLSRQHCSLTACLQTLDHLVLLSTSGLLPQHLSSISHALSLSVSCYVLIFWQRQQAKQRRIHEKNRHWCVVRFKWSRQTQSQFQEKIKSGRAGSVLEWCTSFFQQIFLHLVFWERRWKVCHSRISHRCSVGCESFSMTHILFRSFIESTTGAARSISYVSHLMKSFCPL